MTIPLIQRSASAPLPITTENSKCMQCNAQDQKINFLCIHIFGKEISVCNQSCALNWLSCNPIQKLNGRY